MLSKSRHIVEWMGSLPKKIAIGLMYAVAMLHAPWVSAQTGLAGIPEITVMDPNGVDLLTHLPFVQITDIAIGGDNMGLSHSLNVPAWYNSMLDKYSIRHVAWTGRPQLTDTIYFGGTEINFDNGVPKSENGETLVDIGNNLVQLTQRDGTKITTNKYGTTGAKVGRIETPEGLITEVYYNGSQIRSIVQNNGLQLKYNYNSSGVLTSVVAVNNAVDYCDPLANNCTYTKTWPTVAYSIDQPTTVTYPCQYCPPETVVVSGAYTFTVANPSGSTRYTYSNNRLNAIFKNNTAPVSYKWLDAGKYNSDGTVHGSASAANLGYFVWQIKNGDMVWDYSWSYSNDLQYGSGGVQGPTHSIMAQSNRGLPVSVTSNGTSVLYQADPFRVTSVAFPIGARKFFDFDERGNLIKTTYKADGQVDIVETANYDATCANSIKCNKPNSVTDARGAVTDYEYYTTAPVGFLKSTTSPAGVNGVRPQIRYEYTQRRAWFKNASGAYVAGSPIWLKTKESYCIAGGRCVPGSTDEVVTTYDYGSDAGPNNLFLRGTVKTAFDGQSIKSLRTCYGYDIYGNKISETAPKAQLANCP